MFEIIFDLLPPVVKYSIALIAAAVIPSIWLMRKVYESDHLEKESPDLLKKIALFGALSGILAMVTELILTYVLMSVLEPNSIAYNIVLYFVVVAGAEEFFKYLFLKLKTWNNPEFNCQYDAVVYAVFVSLGFALLENIIYVVGYGLVTAILRAVTAIPGHACYGIFMGVLYGIAKKFEKWGMESWSRLYRSLALIVPILFHGVYDYIATVGAAQNAWIFIVFMIAMFIISFILIKRVSKKDQYI